LPEENEISKKYRRLALHQFYSKNVTNKGETLVKILEHYVMKIGIGTEEILINLSEYICLEDSDG
jgi:hypothetical protein